MPEVQHPQIKFYLSNPELLRASEDLIPIFHRWIQTNVLDELLIDVANYAHVPAGPGILLIGHDSFYSIEAGAEERLGLLYNRRTQMQGANKERILFALQTASRVCSLLEQEELWQKKLRFSTKECKLILNDRYFAPNEEETFRSLREDIEAAFSEAWGHSHFKLSYEKGDPRRAFEVIVKQSS